MKKILIYSSLFISLSLITFTSANCNKNDSDECNACIEAQEHYYDALKANNCDPVICAEAKSKCDAACSFLNISRSYRMEDYCNTNTTPSYNCEN